jgi:hypothetical protein
MIGVAEAGRIDPQTAGDDRDSPSLEALDAPAGATLPMADRPHPGDI